MVFSSWKNIKTHDFQKTQLRIVSLENILLELFVKYLAKDAGLKLLWIFQTENYLFNKNKTNEGLEGILPYFLSSWSNLSESVILESKNTVK